MALLKPDQEIVLERLASLMDRREAQGRPLTQAHIAGALNVSAATVSNFLNRKEVGDLDKLAATLSQFVDREEAKDEGGLIRVPFVETRPARKLLDLFTLCHTWNKMGVGIGGPGIGKTKTIGEAVKRDPTLIVVTAWGMLGATGLLREVAELLRVGGNWSQCTLMKRVRNKLTDKRGDSTGRCIIVDDAHTLSFKALDVLRHIHDTTQTGVVLVGIQTLHRHLSSSNHETEQLASRVASRLWEIPEFSLEDAELFFRAVMGEREVKAAMALLADDPRSISSGRWLGDLLEIAGKFAAKHQGRMGLDDLRKAVKVAA